MSGKVQLVRIDGVTYLLPVENREFKIIQRAENEFDLYQYIGGQWLLIETAATENDVMAVAIRVFQIAAGLDAIQPQA